MGYRWVVKCNNCGADITFKIVYEQYPREAVNNMPVVEPPKPVMMKQSLKCWLCKAFADYASQDLHFR